MTSEPSSRSGPAEAARDPLAFEEFYRRHFHGITRFVARRVNDPHTVADLTAEIFLAVIDSAHTYRPGRGSEAAWVYGIARNVVSAEHRRTARHAELGARIAGRRLLDEDDITRLEEKLDAERASRRALTVLAGLPEGERAVIELDRIRFTAPILPGDEFRLRLTLDAVAPGPAATTRLDLGSLLERRASERPALAATWIVLVEDA